MATVVTPQSRSQSARASRSTVKVPKRRTGWGSPPGGTATQCSAAPMSMPAACGCQTWSASASMDDAGSRGVGTSGPGSRPESLGGVIAASGSRKPTQDSRGGGSDGKTCSLPNGIRTGPVTNDVVAYSRDQPNQRAHGTNAGTVTTTHGLPARIAENARTGPVPSVCVAAQPPIPLTRTLKNDFPQVLPWFQDKDTHLFCDFLSRWPTLKAAQLARRSTLETFFRDHHVRVGDVLAKRIHAIKTATPWPTDEGVIAPNALLVQALVSQLRVTLDAIEAFDHAIAQRAQRHPEFPLFQALPGAGPVFASRLLVAFGEQRERYTSAAARQKYAGVAPVTERRGKKAWVHWRLQCPKFLRHTF